jgi:hypothetical protein
MIHTLPLLAFLQLFAYQAEFHGFHPGLSDMVIPFLEFSWRE